MKMPKLQSLTRERQMLSTFGGYNHNTRIGEGEFYDMKNMTSDHYPVLATRNQRMLVEMEGTVNGMAGYDNNLYYIHNGILRQRNAVGIVTTMMTGLTTAYECSVVRMGNRLLVMGLDTHQICDVDVTDSVGSQEDINVSKSGSFSYTPCKLDGTEIDPPISSTPPETSEDGAYWIDTSDTPHVLKQWSKTEDAWISVPTSYVKISMSGIEDGLRQYDGIRISDTTDLGGMLATVSGARCESSFVVMAVGEGSIIVAGLCDQAGTASALARIERKCPQMQYVVECGNRLWGCSVDGTEIYASKLGDPYNWNCYQGISTDSYAATIGAPGEFTGAVAYGGTVYFFKRDCMIKVYGTQPSNFQITETPCDGVQEGSHRALCTADGMLFYKGKSGVFRYDGSLPEKISDDLGMTSYQSAVGGEADGKYYLSVLDMSGVPHLFVYDIRRDMWHREDGMRMEYCAAVEKELYAVALPEGGVQSMCILNYHTEWHASDLEGAKETDIPYLIETGDIGLDSPDRKYVAQIQLRCSLGTGANLCMDVEYDSSGDWQRVADLAVTSKRSFTLPITLRRCDHFRLRLSGRGECRIFSLTKTIEQGGML